MAIMPTDQLTLTEIGPTLMDIALTRSDFVMDAGVQQRVALDAEKVREYAELYRDGRDLGRLVIFYDRHSYILADGFHRAQAAWSVGLESLPADVYDGTLRDAVLYATGCNLHGKPLTNADKRKRVTTLLRDRAWSHWSDNSIAKHCGVAQSFVSKIRGDLTLHSEISEDEVSATTRTYRDKYGQVRTMDTSQIGQHTGHDGNGIYDLTSGAGSALLAAPGLELEPEVLEADPPPVDVHRNRWGSITTPPTYPQTSGDYEWYTPVEIVTLVQAVLGDIDVDPASCARAQETVQARTFYTLEDDGLRQPWHGTVFCNPPYQMPDVARFCGKLIEELDAGHTTEAVLLVNSVTETAWFQRIAPRAAALCFPNERIPFIHTTKDGMRPCQGQTLLYFGPQVQRFCEVFGDTGLLLQIVRTPVAQLELLTTSTEEQREGADIPTSCSPLPASAPEAASPLVLAAWRMLQQHQPCTNAQVAERRRRKREQTYEALQTLVEQGYARTEGQQYWAVDGPARE
jgi:hypothetical protein